MTIENPKAYLAGVWDWAILQGCFGKSRIMPTDLDGFVEHKGRFLLLEAKASGADLTMGQRIAFSALRDTGLFTIIIVWGETNKPERMELWTSEKKFDPESIDLTRLRDIVLQWYEWAHRRAIHS